MKTTVTFSEFHDSFKRMERDNHFSYQGFRVLYDYFEDYEQDTGEEVELDVIAICCEYAESTWEEIANEYLLHELELDDEEDHEGRVIEYLQDEGVYVGKTLNSIIYRQH
jgi:hypothetical protein